MTETPLTQPSLLLRIRDEQDAVAWSQFTGVYGPLIASFARKHGLQEADAADVTQEVLRLVARAVKRLDYDARRGSFRAWLYTVVRNEIRKMLGRRKDYHASAGGTEAHLLLAAQLAPEKDETAEWIAEYEQRLFSYAACMVRNDFQEGTWNAFWRSGVEGRPAKEVAGELGLSVAAVYLAKSRVMARLKQYIESLQTDSLALTRR